MSIPKEPRQLMINIMYLVLTAMLALNVSAEIFNAFKLVDKGLKKSNDVLDKANANIPADKLWEIFLFCFCGCVQTQPPCLVTVLFVVLVLNQFIGLL